MSQLLVHYDTVIRANDGRGFIPSAWGRRVGETGDLWEGWIQFEPLDTERESIRTQRETEQASFDALVYWAEGLTQVFLEGALSRALAAPAPEPVDRPDRAGADSATD